MVVFNVIIFGVTENTKKCTKTQNIPPVKVFLAFFHYFPHIWGYYTEKGLDAKLQFLYTFIFFMVTRSQVSLLVATLKCRRFCEKKNVCDCNFWTKKFCDSQSSQPVKKTGVQKFVTEKKFPFFIFFSDTLNGHKV